MRTAPGVSSRRLAACCLAALLAVSLLVGCSGDPTPVIAGPGNPSNEPTGVAFVPAVAGEFLDASPVAGDVSVAAYPGIPVTIALSGNGGTSSLQFIVSSVPSEGSLGVPTKTGASTASITYTAPLNFSGPVSFSYQVDDGARRSAPATVRIQVYPRIYFTLDRYEGAAPLTVVGRIATVNGDPLPSGEYRWDWAGVEDSGQVVSQAQRAHTFSQPGVYAVALTVVLNGLAGPVSCSHTPSKDTDRAQVAVGGNTVTISGRVLSATGQPMGGIVVGIGGTLISTTTDAQGNYALTVAAGWSGSVRPLADGFSFQPESRTFGVLNGSQGGQDFTGHASVAPEGVLAVVPADPFAPSGPQGGPFVPNQVEYQISNVGTASVEWTATASHGWLSVSPGSGVLAPGGAAVVAVALNPAVSSFAPGTYPAEVIFANITNGIGNESRSVALTVTPPPTYVISGTVTLDGGGNLAGVTLGGLPGSPVTDASGYFAASVPAGWSGLVVPSKDGYTFAPASRSYAGVSANQSGQSFVASVATYTISGRISDIGGAGISGVILGGLPGNPQTNASGNYSASVNHGWTGTVTPSKAGLLFSPASRTYTAVASSRSNQDYTASTVTYSISGRVADAGGTGIAGVTLGGLPGEPSTDPNGNYAATVVSGWTGTITPSKSGYSFMPLARNLSDVTSDYAGQNFTATLATYTISGRITDGSGIAIEGVQLVGLPGNPLTDPNGHYSTTVNHGWSGTATPTKADYTFLPSTRSYTSVAAAQSGQDYVGTGPGGPQMASSISQYGITWTFDKPYRVGKFVTGDWWVIPDDPNGTVIVQSVSPAPTGNGSSFRNGSMVNPVPGPNHGYDGRSQAFSAATSVGFPLTLGIDSSLVSSISRPEDADFNAATGHRGYISDAAILTCLSVQPSQTAFRPAYCGSPKVIKDAASLNLALLPSVSSVPNTPSPITKFYDGSYALGPSGQNGRINFSRVWLDHVVDFYNQHIHPFNHMEDYGRDIARHIGDALLMLCLNDVGDRSELTLYICQLGIDLYGIAQNGGYWPPNGGHNAGRKAPIVIAGLLLGDDAMRNIGTSVMFQEDAQTFYVSQADVDRLLDCEVSLATSAATGTSVTGVLSRSLNGYATLTNGRVRVASGTGAGQVRTISGSSQVRGITLNAGASLTVEVSTAWDVVPDTSSVVDILGYEQGDIGLPEWGIGHIGAPNRDNPTWSAEYRSVNGYSWPGLVLAARLFGLKNSWGHDALFDYQDRYMEMTAPGGSYPGWRSLSPFQEAMWDTYRAGN